MPVTMLQKEPVKESWGASCSPPVTTRNVECGDGGSRFISKVRPGAHRTRTHPFNLHGVFQSGQVPPSRVCVLETSGGASEHGQEVWPDVCVRVCVRTL